MLATVGEQRHNQPTRHLGLSGKLCILLRHPQGRMPCERGKATVNVQAGFPFLSKE